MRVAILATGWAGFNDAACRELAARGVELLIATEDQTANTEYASHRHDEYATLHTWRDDPAPGEVRDAVRAFAPDAVLMHSWHYAPFREAVKALPAGTLRVLWMDNIWRNVPKQWLGRAVAPWWVRSLFDAVMVPSDRTEHFARRLGFGEADVIRGSLSADTTVFGSGPRDGAEIADRRRFLAALRLVHHKGADVLAEAYRAYRSRVDEPWALDVAGIGPMADCFDAIPGVGMLGFQQPTDVARLMQESSCLVVPSRVEPYGVTLHEGALSGLPIVSTYFVGAAPFFVQDGLNGWTVPGDDADALAEAMARITAAGPDRLAGMSDVSRALGARTSSAGWARHLHEQLSWRTAALRSTDR